MMRLSFASLTGLFSLSGLREKRSQSEGSSDRASMLSSTMEFVLIAMLLAWPLCSSLAYALSASVVDAQFDRRLRATGDAVAAWLEKQHLPLEESAYPVLRDLYTDHAGIPERRLTVMDLQSGVDLVTDHRDLPPAARLHCGNGNAPLQNIDLETGPARSICMYASVVRASQPVPSLVPMRLWLTEPLSGRDAQLREAFLVAAVPVALACLLSVLIAYFGMRRALRPLHVLQQVLGDKAQPSALRDGEPVPAEVAALAEAFNRLVLRVDARLHSEKRFISNAAHQMRAPLAGLQAEADLALKSHDTHAARQHLVLIGHRVESMGRLVNQLMSLARLDDRERLRAGFDVFDLREVCEAAVVRHAAAARAKAVDLGFDCGHQALGLIGNAVLVGEMLSNLIDNAIKYSGAGGEVTVALQVVELSGQVELAVADDGPGLSPEEAQRAFERFARVHPQTAGGCGLGLAIVQEIASLHGAALEVQSPVRIDPARGTAFVVTFDARDRRDRPNRAAT